jgi:hypothetical protein
MIRRIRTLMRIARNLYAIPSGRVLRIPEDLDEASAAAWLKTGLAEEDKMLDGPPEIRDGPASTFKEIVRARRKKCRTL